MTVGAWTVNERRTAGLTFALEHAGWYAVGAVLAFLIPFTFTTVFGINSDLYYGVYFASVLAFLGAYVKIMHIDFVGLFARRWRWSLLVGVCSAAFVVWSVVGRNDSTPRPDGAYFAFTVLWRGLLYGGVDALLLSAFPVAVAWSLFNGRLGGIARKMAFGAVTLLLVLVITATYHLGYEQFREDGVRAPEVGNTVISLPAILTANPLGSLLAHASMHIAADVHVYETDVFLPPERNAD
jgi:hypothetical protein